MNKSTIETLGSDISSAATFEEALKLGGLDFTAKATDIRYQADSEDFLTAPANKVIYKDTDKSVLGIVGYRYPIIQNTEAFAIAEALIGTNMEFRRAGQVLGQTFIVMQGEKSFILGEEVDNYIIIRNSFDGSCKLQIAWIPVAKSSRGTYILETASARVFTLKHSVNWVKKYGKTFVETLVADGTAALEEYAKSMLALEYTPDQLTKVLDQFLPLKTDKEGNIKEGKANEEILQKRQYFSDLLNCQDLAQYGNSVYKVYRALYELETTSFQSAKIRKPTRGEFKKVKRLFSQKSKATEAVKYLQKLING